MKLLIIGASGQMALSLLDICEPGTIEVVAVGRPELDVTDGSSVLKAVAKEQPDCVVNAAAYTAVDQAEVDQDLAFLCNKSGAENIARVCASQNIPLIHLSTDYVYDGAKGDPYFEDDSPDPINVYGRSKFAGERAVIENCSKYIILRTAWLFSPFGKNFVKSMLRLAKDREELNVVSDQYGNPTYAPHLAKVILSIAGQLVDRPGDRWGVYHAVGSGTASWCDVARQVFVEAERLSLPTASVAAITTDDYPTAARRPMNSRLDTTKLLNAFDVSLPRWELGVAECVRRLAVSHQM